MIRTHSGFLALALFASASGCRTTATVTQPLMKFAPADPGVSIAGLSSCIPGAHGPLELDQTRPINVLVHGCNFSRGGFRTLASVFEAHDQQTICFSYNDRDSLAKSSANLIKALAALESHIAPEQITVLGHSQGGLVARRAFITERRGALVPREGFSYRLVTVSSPFGGIASSSDCGRVWLRFASLGVTTAVCQAIAGSKWTEIYPGSDFMTHPGTLGKAVTSHLKIVTDERGTCRRLNADGSCAEADSVFSLAEQYNEAVDADSRMAAIRVEAGHVEIVGEHGNPPTKLIRILQEKDVLAQTPPERREEFAALLQRLY
jgi:pimeloyl-ACP methyl ester carboxylesterase